MRSKRRCVYCGAFTKHLIACGCHVDLLKIDPHYLQSKASA